MPYVGFVLKLEYIYWCSVNYQDVLKILRWKKARQVKINSTRVDLIPRGLLFASMMNIWSVSRNSIPFAIQTNVIVTSFIIPNVIFMNVLARTLKFQSWNQRFVKYFRCKHILEKFSGCQHDDFETIVTQGSVVFCIWSWLSLSYVVSLLTCRRSVKRISRNGNDVLWVTYRLPPGVDYWTKLSGISCDKTLPFSKTEFRLKIPRGLSFCLMRIPVHGRVKKPWIYESWSSAKPKWSLYSRDQVVARDALLLCP